MQIIKKEILCFSENEKEAIDLVQEITDGLVRHSEDPRIAILARNISLNLSELLMFEEELEG
jgi:hypothetical protein